MKTWIFLPLLIFTLSGWSQLSLELTYNGGCSPMATGIYLSGDLTRVSMFDLTIGDTTYLQLPANQTFYVILYEGGYQTIKAKVYDEGNNLITTEYASVHVKGIKMLLPTTVTDAGSNLQYNSWCDCDTMNWKFGDGTMSDRSYGLHHYWHAGTYQLVLNGHAGVCGWMSDTIEITVTDTLLKSWDKTACVNSTVHMQNWGELWGISSWEWDFGDGQNLTTNQANDVQHIYSSAGEYTVILKGYDAQNQLLGQLDRTISVQEIQFDVSPGKAAINQEVEFVPHGLYSNSDWDFGDMSTATDRKPTHAYAAAGTYQVQLTASSEACGNKSIQQAVEVLDYFLKDSIADTCGVPYEAFFEVLGNTSGYSFFWNFGDGDTLTGISATQNHLYQQTGVYPLEVSLISPTDTILLISKNIMVGAIVAISNHTAAINQPISFYSTGAIDSIAWNFGDGTTGTGLTTTHTYAAPGTYDINATVYTSHCGVLTYTDSVNIHNIQFDHIAVNKCVGTTNTFSYSGSYPLARHFKVDFGDGTTADTTGTILTHEYQFSKIYPVVMEVYDSVMNLLIRQETEVSIFKLPEVYAGNDDTLCFWYNIILSGSGTAVSYVWNNDVINGAAFNQYSEVITYTVTGTDAKGCSSNDQVTIWALSCEGLAEYSNAPPTLLYPNPTQQSMVWEGSKHEAYWQIHSLSGTMMTGGMISTKTNIDVSNLSPGMYLFNVLDQDQKRLYGQRFVIE